MESILTKAELTTRKQWLYVFLTSFAIGQIFNAAHILKSYFTGSNVEWALHLWFSIPVTIVGWMFLVSLYYLDYRKHGTRLLTLNIFSYRLSFFTLPLFAILEWTKVLPGPGIFSVSSFQTVSFIFPFLMMIPMYILSKRLRIMNKFSQCHSKFPVECTQAMTDLQNGLPVANKNLKPYLKWLKLRSLQQY